MSDRAPAPVIPAPSTGAQAAGMATGSVALLMLGLQPLLLGTLADEGRLDVDGIGNAATAELLALGITTGLLSALARPVRLRSVNVAAALALACANLWGMTAGHGWLVASRGAAGVASGFLVWIAVALITRSGRPDRMSGVFLTVQTLAQALLAACLPLTLMPAHGASGGLASLAALALGAAFLSPWLPDRLPSLPQAEAGSGGLPAVALVGLGSVFLWMAGIVGLWVFVEQLGHGEHIGARAAGLAVAAALVAQVTGSLSATVLSGILPAVAVLCAAGIANVLVTRVLSGSDMGATAYLSSVVLFGFLWLFSMPFQTRLLIDLDPSRRAAMLLSAAQLLGSAAGPVITSAFVTKTSLTDALTADAALFAASTTLVAVLALSVRGWRVRLT